MIKSRKEILGELINDQKEMVITKEVGIKSLEKMDPEMILSTKLDGTPMKVKSRIEIMKKELQVEEIRLQVLRNEFNA